MSAFRRPGPLHVALLVAGIGAIVWGALAFGAVYPWAYTPLALACALVGSTAIVGIRGRRPPVGAVAAGLAAIGAAVSLQLVPLSPPTLARLSPGADDFLRQYHVGYALPRVSDAQGDDAARAAPAQPLSIAPDKTALGLVLFAGFALFLVGSARLV